MDLFVYEILEELKVILKLKGIKQTVRLVQLLDKVEKHIKEIEKNNLTDMV